MKTLTLNRPSKRDATWTELTAQLHNEARVARMQRFEARKANLDVRGVEEVIKDPKGRWVSVYGEFSYDA